MSRVNTNEHGAMKHFLDRVALYDNASERERAIARSDREDQLRGLRAFSEDK